MLSYNVPAPEPAGDHYWKLVSKLRWIGLEDEAARIQAELLLSRKDKKRSIFAEAPDTD